jgi:hypothetical protein
LQGNISGDKKMSSYEQALRLVSQSNIIAQGLAAASMAILKATPPWACKVKGTISGGAANTGTITITGTVAGVAGVTEVLTYSQAQWILGNKMFSAFSAITTSGLADETVKPTLKIEAVDSVGNPKFWVDASVEYYPCSFHAIGLQSGSGAYQFLAAGKTAVQIFQVRSDEDIPIDEHSQFTVDDITDLDGTPILFEVFSIDAPILKSGGLKVGLSFLATRVSA